MIKPGFIHHDNSRERTIKKFQQLNHEKFSKQKFRKSQNFLS